MHRCIPGVQVLLFSSRDRPLLVFFILLLRRHSRKTPTRLWCCATRTACRQTFCPLEQSSTASWCLTRMAKLTTLCWALTIPRHTRYTSLKAPLCRAMSGLITFLLSPSGHLSANLGVQSSTGHISHSLHHPKTAPAHHTISVPACLSDELAKGLALFRSCLSACSSRHMIDTDKPSDGGNAKCVKDAGMP